jgi:hypothetical protein
MTICRERPSAIQPPRVHAGLAVRYAEVMDPQTRGRVFQGVTSRLKFPQLLVVTAVLFVLDLLIPDLVPFADEILLALATALFALWREPVPSAPPEKPPEKNVTPR